MKNHRTTRWFAVFSLYSLLWLQAIPCRAGDDAIAPAIKTLQDRNNPHRYEAAQKLGDIGAKAQEAIPALIAALEDEDRIQAAACFALGKIGPATVPPLLNALGSHKASRVRIAIIDIFEYLGPAAKDAGPMLIKMSNDSDPSVRLATVRALDAIRQPEAEPALRQRLITDPDFGVRRYAAAALGRLGAKAQPAVESLINVLQETEYRTRTGADDVPDSGQRGPFGKGVLDLKWQACDALAGIGGVAVPGILKAIPKADPGLRHDLFSALYICGPDARAAVPIVSRFLHDPDATVREDAASTLGQIGRGVPAAADALRAALKDRSGIVHVSAARALLSMAPADKAALAVLLDSLRDDDPKARLGVATALGDLELEVSTPRVVAGLRTALKDSDEDVRRAAVYSLGRQSWRTSLAVPGLAEALNDTSEEIRESVVQLLAEREPTGAVVAALIKGLRNPSAEVRVMSARAIRKAGDQAGDAAPILEGLLKDHDKAVRQAAQEALSQIKVKVKAAGP